MHGRSTVMDVFGVKTLLNDNWKLSLKGGLEQKCLWEKPMWETP